jgi:hypothetical protein
MWRKLFTEHPASVDESYLQHMRVAASFGVPMILGGLACLVHALIPGLFPQTGSRMVKQLNERLGTCPKRAKAYRAMSVPAE